METKHIFVINLLAAVSMVILAIVAASIGNYGLMTLNIVAGIFNAFMAYKLSQII